MSGVSFEPAALCNLLPCLVAGDLPPDLAADVQAAVDRDAALVALVAAIRSGNDACRDQVREWAGPTPTLSVAPRPLPARHGAWPSLALALAAALLLWVGWSQRAGTELFAVADRGATATQAQAGFIVESDPAALSAALRGRGLTATLAMVPDLRPMGIELVGGLDSPEGRYGSVLVYARGDQRFVCQMFTTLEGAAVPALTATVHGTLLRAYERPGGAVVVWRELGMVCVFAGPLPAADLLAMVAAKRGAHG